MLIRHILINIGTILNLFAYQQINASIVEKNDSPYQLIRYVSFCKKNKTTTGNI